MAEVTCVGCNNPNWSVNTLVTPDSLHNGSTRLSLFSVKQHYHLDLTNHITCSTIVRNPTRGEFEVNCPFKICLTVNTGAGGLLMVTMWQEAQVKPAQHSRSICSSLLKTQYDSMILTWHQRWLEQGQKRHLGNVCDFNVSVGLSGVKGLGDDLYLPFSPGASHSQNQAVLQDASKPPPMLHQSREFVSKESQSGWGKEKNSLV